MGTEQRRALIALMVVCFLGGIVIGAYVGVEHGERNWRKPCLAFLEEAVRQQNENDNAQGAGRE